MRKTAPWRTVLTTAAAVTGAVSALALTAAPAQAAPAKPTSLYAPSALVLTIADGESAATTAPQRAVTLNCMPAPSGTHPAAEEACAQLRASGGNLEALAKPAEETYCTKEWRPVVVTAQGVWEGQRVNYEHVFANSCMKRATEASVFAF
ncbi:subtilase-type protease inhibitor [Streptomyces spirodelae]|uniref:Probable subtilase-type protease inhibitor n=1 Tax=Streptomyces spirodelae TaxID=2812904 RepID=A0ABS3WMC9_9ACTN|nr:subtilase-type protease inhibitor [Streptomyces spirodelae]MBO8184279.1 subtilase-type protease inhibitor [Streptomyces spirodelae]